MMSVASPEQIGRLPKTELHLHLEGGVSPELHARFRRKHGLGDGTAVPPVRGFSDLASFLVAYDDICGCMRDAADFHDATWEVLSRAAASNVRHLEMFFSPHAHDGVPYSEMLDGIMAAFDRAGDTHAMSALLIPAHSRELGPDRGLEFLDMVLSDRRERVVGIGLDYDERPHPPAPFVRLYERAQAEGLQVTAHAGEGGPAANVRVSVERLGCRRIDHGYHVVDEPDLVELCRSLDVLFTVCPTTTLNTTGWRDLSDRDHAIRRMIEAGLRVSIATDDPGLFGVTLDGEYAAVASSFGLGTSTLHEIAINGVTHSWLPQDARLALEQSFRAEIRLQDEPRSVEGAVP